jgi:hypothetical protein
MGKSTLTLMALSMTWNVGWAPELVQMTEEKRKFLTLLGLGL